MGGTAAHPELRLAQPGGGLPSEGGGRRLTLGQEQATLTSSPAAVGTAHGELDCSLTQCPYPEGSAMGLDPRLGGWQG